MVRLFRIISSGITILGIKINFEVIWLFKFRTKAWSVSSVQLLSCVQFCDPMDCPMPGLPVHCQLPEFTQTHVHWVGDAIQPSLSLLFPSSPTFNLSQHQMVFSNESVLHIRWPTYWSFSFSISPSKEYSGLISFRMDWLDLLAVQGTLKSLKLPYASYASQSEGRQTENHNHRKPTNLTTWTTALSNSVKLWGMPCRAT